MQGVAGVTQCGSPVPRYRLQQSTGRWRKEVGRAGTATSTTAAAGAENASVDAKHRCAEPCFVSTFDYLLQHAGSIRHADAAAALRAKQRRDTFDDIDAFCRRRSLHQRVHAATDEMLSDGCDMTAIAGSPCAAADRCLPNDDDASMENSRVQTATDEIWGNPLMGYLVCAPLYGIHDALVSLKGAAAVHNVGGLPHTDTHLTYAEFLVFLANVGPVALLSDGLKRRMFRSLPGYRRSLAAVPVFALLNYVIVNSHHPNLDRTVQALFRAFDPEHRGQVPAEALHHRVVSAWAETYTFGQLRRQWLELAEALSEVVPCGLSAEGWARWPALLDKKTVRAYLCSSASLYHVANAINIYRDGALL